MKKTRSLGESFLCALAGVVYAFKTQRNIKIHFSAAIIVVLLSFILKLSISEILAISLTVTMVLVAEMINTAIETVVDMYTTEYHPLAKAAKNVAAGAVLISTVNAVIVGYIIFFRKIIMLLNM